MESEKKYLTKKEKKRLLIEYGNADLSDMCNLGSVKYCFVLWLNLGVHTLKSKLC
jgi:hypothetical protein